MEIGVVDSRVAMLAQEEKRGEGWGLSMICHDDLIRRENERNFSFQWGCSLWTFVMRT